jgi:glutamate-1-semialdehyde aminotransferase
MGYEGLNRLVEGPDPQLKCHNRVTSPDQPPSSMTETRIGQHATFVQRPAMVTAMLVPIDTAEKQSEIERHATQSQLQLQLQLSDKVTNTQFKIHAHLIYPNLVVAHHQACKTAWLSKRELPTW